VRQDPLLSYFCDSKLTLFSCLLPHRIGTCRKKVMGLLRLMGNKADVVKGLSKRCNENWTVAPKSDIVRFSSRLSLPALCSPALRSTGSLSLRYSRSHHDLDSEFDSLRKDSLSFSFQLPRSNLNRDVSRLNDTLVTTLLTCDFDRTDANNQINDVLSKLTALGTVLIPVRLTSPSYVSGCSLMFGVSNR